MANRFGLSAISVAIAVWHLLVDYQNWVLTRKSSPYSRNVHTGLVEFVSSAKHGTRKSANGNGFFIVGMHRSGTSVLAGTLNIMGYSAGDGKLKGATDYNPKGYFEMSSLIIQNQDWLIEQGVAWGVGSGEFDPSLAKLNTTGRDTLRNIDVSEPWMLKDPRICLTLPAWDRYFAHPPHAVFTYRHPLSVALSTCQRSQTELFYGLRSWLFHNMNAIQNLKGRCVVHTSHKAMMEHPLDETLRISSELTNQCGISKPALESEDETSSRISNFISHSMHHNHEVIQNGVDKPTLRRMFRDCSFPRAERVSDLNMKMYNLTMKTYEDIESGKAFIDAYEWPELFDYRGSPKTRVMKIYKERPPPSANDPDGTATATSDKHYPSENINEVMVSEEKVLFSKDSLVDTVPRGIKTQNGQGGLSKIGMTEEEWSALRKRMLGAQDKSSTARQLRRKAKQGAF